VLSAAFSNSVFKDGNNSNIINLSSDKAVVVRIDQQVPAKLKPLKAVAPEIKTLLAQKAERMLAKSHAAALLQSLKKGNAQAVTDWHSEEATRSDTTHALALVQEAFRLAAPAAKGSSYGMTELKDGSVVIVALDKVVPGKVDAMQITSYQKQLQALLAKASYQNYVNAMKAQAKIKYSS